MAGTNVPGLENSAPQFSQNVPGVQFPYRQEAGREGMALQHLGEGIESAAHAGGEIYDEIQRQHDISTASKNYVDAGVSHAQQMQNLKLSSPDGFVHDTDTNEVVKNRDGSQRTIAQEYWNWADSDYQDRQKAMSPRAAAMFRQQMQSEIGQNTKLLQNTQLELQRKSADQDVVQGMASYARDNDRTPYPDAMPYYEEKREDGSVNLRGNTYKINSQLATLKLWTQRQGPVGDQPGMYGPTDIDKLTTKRLSDHANDWVRSAVTDILENDTPRDHKNRVSTTAYQQVLNLRDVIEGKDPMSSKADSQGLPTVKSSLTSEQADKWRNQLNSMLDGAKKIDRTDYEFQLQQMKQASKLGQFQSPDQLMNSPQFSYLMHAAQPLGLTPEEHLKNVSEIFSNAASSPMTAGFDLSSESAKRQQIMTKIEQFSKAWPQYGQMLGAHFTGAMADALKPDVQKGALANLKEETTQFKADPAKYAAGASSSYSPDGAIHYRNKTMKGVEDHMFQDPSLFAALKPMANGNSVITNAIGTMKRIGAQGFGQGYDVNFLSKDAYEGWAKKIERSGNPEQVEQMFHQLNHQAGADAGTVMDQLVKVGNLDQRYQTAQNLPTAQARIAAYADIMSKGAAIEAYTKSEDGESAGEIWKKAGKANHDIIDFNNRLYGADSPEASKAIKALNQTWASAYASARGVKGTSQSEAAQAADERVRAQIAPISNVQNEHHWLGGMINFGTGPASRVQFSRADLDKDQQTSIQQNLLKAQGVEELSKYQIAPAPITQGAYDFNKKVNAQWIAEHPFIWYPVGKGPDARYRLQYQGMNADGSPNGRGYDLRVFGSDGSPRYYEMKESDALKKSGQ